MRAIPLPENLGMFLKGGKSWKRKKKSVMTQFLLGEGVYFFWFLHICPHLKYPLKNKSIFSILLMPYGNREIRWRSEKEYYFIYVSFQINTFPVVYGRKLIFHRVDPKCLKQNGYLWINLLGLQFHHSALFLWEAQERFVIY